MILVLQLTSSGGRAGVPGSRDRTSSSQGGSGGGRGTSTSPNPLSGGVALDSHQFAPGSCMAFAPTQGDTHKTVFLDAGHGGVDPGAVGTTKSGVTIYEKNSALAVELDALALLRADGFRVVVSRTTGGPVAAPRPGYISNKAYTTTGAHAEVAERDVCANLGRADVLIGIYFDAGSSPLDAGSVTDWDAVRPFSNQNLKLAKLLQHNVLSAMNAHGWGIPSAGVSLDIYEGGPALTAAAAAYDHLLLLGPAKVGYFSTPSEMPGALIEPLFVTDPYEASLAASTEGQEVIAGGIAKTAEQFLGVGGG